MTETLTRYCPGCGSVGSVPETFRDCCPDGNQARMIPEPLALKCRDTFKLAVGYALADMQSSPAEPAAAPPAAQRDELLQVALDFIGTLTGMTPPPIEVAPPEVFAPFYSFVDRVQAITSAPAAPTTKAQPAPTFQDLQDIAVKHSCWVPGYGPFAVELLATYGAAPAEQPHWVYEWLNAMNYVRRNNAEAEPVPVTAGPVAVRHDPDTWYTEAVEITKEALRDYHNALENRQHGGAAASKALSTIQDALDMRCEQGEEPAPAAVEPVAWRHTNRLGGVQVFTTEPPPGLKERCQPLFASPKASPADALDAFTLAELLEVRRACDDFADCGETDVSDALLMRAANAGYLQCAFYEPFNRSALDRAIAAAMEAQNKGGA